MILPENIPQTLVYIEQKLREDEEALLPQSLCVEDVARKKIYQLTYSTIHYINSAGNQSVVYAEHENTLHDFWCARSLKWLEKMLPPKFFRRTHKLHIINLHDIHCVLKDDNRIVQLKCGKELPVSKTKIVQLRKDFIQGFT